MTTTTFDFKTVSEIRVAHQRNRDINWFAPPAMKFFKTKIPNPTVYFGCYFITSEQFVDSRGNASPRMFSVRKINSDYGIDTVGGFNEFTTRGEAVNWLKSNINTLKD